MNDPTTVDVLEAGLATLRKRGWTQGRLEDRHGAVCAMGANARALVELSGLDAPITDGAGGQLAAAVLTNISDAVAWTEANHALAAALPDGWGSLVASYNNFGGRTQDEIEDLFQRAIRAEKAKAAEPVPLSVGQPAPPATVDGTQVTRELAAR